MVDSLMHMKIVLPFEILLEKEGVARITVETSKGSAGILPLRLDCVMFLVPGILTYQCHGNEEQYVAIDEGLLIKKGQNVSISVRQGIAQADLGTIRKTIEERLKAREKKEQHMRKTLSQLESSLVKQCIQEAH